MTSDGGRISSNASALRSSASWHSARAERGARPALHREHRAADLGGALVVEDAERGGGLPVRHPLMIGERRGHVDRSLDHRVVAVTAAIGRVGMRQVGDHEEVVTQGAAHRVVFGREGLLLVAERPALGLERFGGGDVAAAPPRRSRPTSFDISLTLALIASRSAVMSRRRASRSAARSTDREHRRVAAPADRGADTVEVGAQQSNVDHSRVRLPVVVRAGQSGSGVAGTRANSRSTSAVVSGASSWPVISAVGIWTPRR